MFPEHEFPRKPLHKAPGKEIYNFKQWTFQGAQCSQVYGAGAETLIFVTGTSES